MSIINAKKPKPESHLNYMGGVSYDINDPVKVLRIIASSCFFGEPMYYQKDPGDKRPTRYMENNISAYLSEVLGCIVPRDLSNMTPANAIESAVDKALDADPERTLQEAVRLRQESHIRTTPQVILVRAANHPKVRGTGLVKKYAPGILQRADEPAVGLAYQFWRYGKNAPVPNSLKKAWAAKLATLSEYSLAKYRLGEREVKLVDVVNLTHPKSEAVGKLVKGQLSTTDQTWESIISKEGSNKASWQKAIGVMGHMALLRNLRNFLDKGVDPSFFLDALVAGAKDGKQLPFRYYSAYQAVGKSAPPQVLDGIEKCLEISLGNLPRFPGKTMALADNSGSAQGTTTSSMGTAKISTIGNLTGILAGMASDEGYLGVFGDRLEVFPIRKSSSVFDQLGKAENAANTIGQSTENGIWLFWDKAIREKQHWDNVFVFSDMQAGHGGLYGASTSAYKNYTWQGGHCIDVAKLVNKYRNDVNPNVNVFLVQIAGYKDTILPEFYKRTYILGGWGEGVLKFAAEMAAIVPKNS